MTRRLVVLCLGTFLPLTAIASDHDFDRAVSSIEETYHVRRQHVPMLGFASSAAHVATGGDVKGLQIATFDEEARLPEGADMPGLVRASLGSGWSLMVEVREMPMTQGYGEQDAIFVRPHGGRMTVLVASYDDGGLSVVRMDLNAEQFGKWMADPVKHARHAETN